MKNLLSEMMNDEKKAPYDYARLQRRLKTKRERKIISSIIRDERKHLRKLRKIKKLRR
jgi:rubrerythrin